MTSPMDHLTMAEKVWNNHIVLKGDNGEPDLIYIDLQLLHEVTSPQAFDGLRLAGRALRRPDLTLATEDHNVPTEGIKTGAITEINDLISRTQVETLRKNAEEFGVRIHPMGDVEQGIVHVVGPQLGLTQPGMTVVCGDSHTATHGAFGAIAFGIGTSEVEHVMATQTLPLKPFKTMAINVSGELPDGVTAKDLILAIIAKIGTGGGQGHIIEYRGEAIEKLSMEARMTICNMSIEAGARAGMIAPDEVTFNYLKDRPHAPQGADWDAAVGRACVLTTAQCSTLWWTLTDPPSPRLLPGELTPARVCRSAHQYRTPTSSPKNPHAPPQKKPWTTWVSHRELPCGRFRLTPSSSVPAPTAASKICAPLPKCSKAAPSPIPYGCSWFPAPPGCANKQSLRGWTTSSPPQEQNGASPDVPCAWE